MSATPPVGATRSAPEIFDRKLLARRRDRIAGRASDHDFLLAHAADDIADRLSITRRTFDRAVVLGAAHGLLGRRLRALPNVTAVAEADISFNLLVQADGPRILADEELLPFRAASLDLVTSALAFQHVNDLPGTLAQIVRALKPDGLLLASMIGGTTLHELRDAFLSAESELEGGASPRVSPFIDVRDAGALLQRAGFALPVADSDTLTVTYATPFDLMREVKAMGASNVLVARRRAPLRRSTLLRAAEIYAERYATADGRICATFEFVTLTGWAPHESQQKPLAPGSAKARLADVLGVRERKT